MGRVTKEKLSVCVLDKLFIERSGSKHKPIINRAIEQVDGCVDVDISSNRPFHHSFTHRLSHPLTARIEPAFAKGLGKLWIGLGLRNQ